MLGYLPCLLISVSYTLEAQQKYTELSVLCVCVFFCLQLCIWQYNAVSLFIYEDCFVWFDLF